jgi:hypothetical protein
MRSEHLLPGALVSSRDWPNPSWRARLPMMPAPVDPLCIVVQRCTSRYGASCAELLIVGSATSTQVRHLTYEKINWHLLLKRGAPGNMPPKRGRSVVHG